MKKKILLIGLAILIFSFYIANSYGLFESVFASESTADIAKWNVSINGTSITGDTTTFVINNLNILNDSNVKPGKFAPTSSAYFDVNIDPNDSEVAIRYDITVDLSNIDNDEIIFQNVANVTLKQIIRTGENTYSGVLTMDNINNELTDTIRFTFRWNDNDLNNSVDYETGTKFIKTLDIPVSVHLSQYLGETINPYTE